MDYNRERAKQDAKFPTSSHCITHSTLPICTHVVTTGSFTDDKHTKQVGNKFCAWFVSNPFSSCLLDDSVFHVVQKSINVRVKAHIHRMSVVVNVLISVEIKDYNINYTIHLTHYSISWLIYSSMLATIEGGKSFFKSY